MTKKEVVRYLPEDVARLVIVVLALSIGRLLFFTAIGLTWMVEKGFGAEVARKIERFFDAVFGIFYEAAGAFIGLTSYFFSPRPSTQRQAPTAPI